MCNVFTIKLKVNCLVISIDEKGNTKKKKKNVAYIVTNFAFHVDFFCFAKAKISINIFSFTTILSFQN